MFPKTINLLGVPWRVTYQDGQYIFEEEGNLPTFFNRITFEFVTIGWFIVDLDTSADRISAQYVKAAIDWLDSNFVINIHDTSSSITFVGNDNQVQSAKELQGCPATPGGKLHWLCDNMDRHTLINLFNTLSETHIQTIENVREALNDDLDLRFILNKIFFRLWNLHTEPPTPSPSA